MIPKNAWKYVTGLAGFGALIWLLFGFFGIQALFMDRVVDESIPLVATSTEPVLASVDPSLYPVPLPPEQVISVPSSSNPQLVAQGTFQQGDSTYTIQGKATVTEKDGVRTLALTDFDVTNGPDLFVYVISAPDASNQSVKESVRQERFVNLGTLKGNRGNQTYLIPPEVKLDDQSIISVWCRRFFRNFGAADLRLAL